ncbi:MAG: hypothetical protein ABI637_11030 [Gemmatimonadota bacterium]
MNPDEAESLEREHGGGRHRELGMPVEGRWKDEADDADELEGAERLQDPEHGVYSVRA